MRDVGATKVVLSGAVCGGRNDYRALGAIIPILFTIFGYIFIYDKLGGVLFSGGKDDAAASFNAAVADLIRDRHGCQLDQLQCR